MSANGDGRAPHHQRRTRSTCRRRGRRTARGLVLTSYRSGNPDLFSIVLPARQLDEALVAARPQPRRPLVARRPPHRGDDRVRRQSRDRAAQPRRLAAAPAHRPLGDRRLALVVARRAAARLLLRPLRRAADLRHGRRRRHGAAGQHVGELQHLAELVAEGRSHRLRVARRRPLPDLHGEDGRQRRAPGHQQRRAATRTRAGRPTVATSSSARRGAGASKLYLADAAGANQVELTEGNGSDSSPSWSGWLE